MAFKQPDLFRFTLSIDGVNHILENAPDGWRNQSFEMSRDPQYFGVLKKFVTDLDFVLNGAKLVRKKFYESGIDGKVNFIIEKLNQSTYQYYQIYESEIDFSTFEDSINRVKTNLIDGGLTAKLQAYKNVIYDIPFDETDPLISLGGVDILEWVNMVAASFSNTGTGNMAYYFPSTQVTNYSLVLAGTEVRSQTQADGVITYDFTTGDNCFLVAKEYTGNIRIRGYVVINAQQEANNGWRLKIRDSSTSSGNVKTHLIDTFSANPEQYLNKRYDFDVVISVVSGRKYFLTVESINPQNFSVCFMDIIASEIKIDYTHVSENVIIKAKRPKKLLLEILNKINEDSENFVTSNLLDENENIFVTSGDAIRALPDALLKTNFNDFFKSFFSVLSAGMSINNDTMEFEKIDKFMDDQSEIVDLGEVKNLKIIPYTEIMHSSIKVGYEKHDYEVERGREEFNNSQDWSTPIVRTQTKLDLISPYRADQYGIDELRIKQIRIDANEKDTDTSQDNDVFMIQVLPDEIAENTFKPITSNDLDYVTGVSQRSTAYNFLLSPKRNLLRHSKLLKSMFYGDNDNGQIKFASADKNADLITKEVLKPEVIEKQDIDINNLSDRLYLPMLAEFDAPYKSDLQYLIDLDRNGYISFSSDEKKYRGFINNVEISADKGGQTTFTVILTKDNDLT